MADELDISLPADFEESLNKTILLTGAGFTKNFGGLLASEVWQFIFYDHDTPDTIKSVMREKSGNYEEIFGFLEGNDSEKYIEILQKQFKLMDDNIIHEMKKGSQLN